MAASFAEFEQDFLQFTSEIVWCTVTTVDTQGRPRSRILHPIWQVLDGLPIGWVFTNKSPLKSRHLAANPHVACSYWSPAQNTVMIDCVARWVEDAATKQQVWNLFINTPPPLGYDLREFGVSGPDSPAFTPLRLDPWRVQLLRFAGFGNRPRMWRAEEQE